MKFMNSKLMQKLGNPGCVRYEEQCFSYFYIFGLSKVLVNLPVQWSDKLGPHQLAILGLPYSATSYWIMFLESSIVQHRNVLETFVTSCRMLIDSCMKSVAERHSYNYIQVRECLSCYTIINMALGLIQPQLRKYI